MINAIVTNVTTNVRKLTTHVRENDQCGRAEHRDLAIKQNQWFRQKKTSLFKIKAVDNFYEFNLSSGKKEQIDVCIQTFELNFEVASFTRKGGCHSFEW